MLKWQARGKCFSGNRASRCLHLCLTAGRPRPADSDFGLRQVDVAAVDGARAVVAGDGGHVMQHVTSENRAIHVRAVQKPVLVLIVVEVPNFSTSCARPRPPGTRRTCPARATGGPIVLVDEISLLAVRAEKVHGEELHLRVTCAERDLRPPPCSNLRCNRRRSDCAIRSASNGRTARPEERPDASCEPHGLVVPTGQARHRVQLGQHSVPVADSVHPHLLDARRPLAHDSL